MSTSPTTSDRDRTIYALRIGASSVKFQSCLLESEAAEEIAERPTSMGSFSEVGFEFPSTNRRAERDPLGFHGSFIRKQA